MSVFLTQVMNGIGNGAVYASLALALVLIFRTTGILNFAQGEMALYSTYLFWYFTDIGLPVIVAIALSMAISFVGGALIERIVIRPVEHSSPLVIVIVTIGLFLAINSLAQLFFGSGQRALPTFYPHHIWRPGGIIVSSDTLVLVAVLAVECLLLYLLLQRTKLGLAFRGVPGTPSPAGCSASPSVASSWWAGAWPPRSAPSRARWRSRPRPASCPPRCSRSSCSPSRPPRSAASTACSARSSAA